MKLKYLLLLIPCLAFADDTRPRGTNPTSVIEDSMCIPDISGVGCLHVDEDVSGLIVQVYGDDGVLVALYDAATEIEDIAAIGTYAAPSASNVRVSPQAASGADYTQMMLADAVYNGQDWITISVSDGQTTILDFKRTVYLAKSLVTAQAVLDTLGRGLAQVDTTIATLANQFSFTLTAGSSDDNAYNRCTAMITDQSTAEQIAMGDIMDYTGSTKTVLLRFDPGIFTMATGDLVTITCLGR
jgi:hypothetical protein